MCKLLSYLKYAEKARKKNILLCRREFCKSMCAQLALLLGNVIPQSGYIFPHDFFRARSFVPKASYSTMDIRGEWLDRP